PAAEAPGVVARAEVVVARFRVALFAFEFVVVLRRAGIRVGRDFTAERREIAVITHHAVVLRHDARRAQEVFDVEEGIRSGGEHGHAFAAEEDIFGRGVVRAVGFGENFVPRAVPVKLTTGFVDAAAVAVVGIRNARRGLHLAFG